MAPWTSQVIKFVREIVAPDDWKLAKQLLNTTEKLVGHSCFRHLIMLDSIFLLSSSPFRDSAA